jgi:hypothetical protein
MSRCPLSVPALAQRVAHDRQTQNTTKVMMSLGRQVLFSTPPLRPLNGRPQSRHRR